MLKRPSVRFDAELIEGHKGVTAVMIPFDPEVLFASPPVRLDPRRDGWLVEGTVQGARLLGYIGLRWGRFFLIIDEATRAAAKVKVGDRLSFALASTCDLEVLAVARQQCVMTTAPKKGRPDALVLDAEVPKARRAPIRKRRPAH